MEDRIRIYYPQGKMELVLSQFFPCLVRQAKIIFPLINTYADESEKDKVRQYLTGYANNQKERMTAMEEGRIPGRRTVGYNYHRTQALYKRALRNLEFLED